MEIRSNARRLPFRVVIAALIALTVIGAILRAEFYQGLLGSDDLYQAYDGYRFFRNLREGIMLPYGLIAHLRIGVHFPVWCAYGLAGTREWAPALAPAFFSLLGVWLLFFVVRILTNDLSGLLAACLLVFLPLDIYWATMWLQDTIYATCGTGVLLLVVLAERSPSVRRAAVLAFLAGLVVAYTQFVKEAVVILYGALLLWGLLRLPRTRRPMWIMLWVSAGCLIGFLLSMVYWLKMTGSPLFYFKVILANTFSLNRARPWFSPKILYLIQFHFLTHRAFGCFLLLSPLLFLLYPVAYRGRDRLLCIFFAGAMLFTTYMGLRLGPSQSRYWVISTPSIILISALTLFPLLARLGRRSLWASAGLILLLTALTACGIHHRHQKPYRHRRGYKMLDERRKIHAFLSNREAPDMPVFADRRTHMMLHQLNGFRPYAGGLYIYPTHFSDDRKKLERMSVALREAFGERCGLHPERRESWELDRGYVFFDSLTLSRQKRRGSSWEVPFEITAPENWEVLYKKDQGGREIILYEIHPVGEKRGPPATISLTEVPDGTMRERIEGGERLRNWRLRGRFEDRVRLTADEEDRAVLRFDLPRGAWARLKGSVEKGKEPLWWVEPDASYILELDTALKGEAQAKLEVLLYRKVGGHRIGEKRFVLKDGKNLLHFKTGPGAHHYRLLYTLSGKGNFSVRSARLVRRLGDYESPEFRAALAG